ncbi:MAG: ribonuclease P protein component [Verrucomicrobia bacterium]|nr:MAG: ribonuclease P protein component [Verrucomicrobiota bacterium]
MTSPAPSRRGLSRDARLKHGRDFARLKQSGQRAVNGCLIANWLALPAGSRSRLGVVVSRKVGNAVARSRARRLMRESFRLHQLELREPLDLVLVARPSIAKQDYAGVEKDFLSTLRRAGLLNPA